MDSSEADSEEDRRAYGQYASLDAYGSDVDEQAAAYLHSVQMEAARLPDVMIASHNGQSRAYENSCNLSETSSHDFDGHRAEISASSEWMQIFLAKFANLRAVLQSVHGLSTEYGHTLNGGGPPEDQAALTAISLAGLKKTLKVSRVLDQTIAAVVQSQKLLASDACKIFGLCAVLDYPLDANTDACLSRLLQHCQALRPLADCQTHAILDVLTAIAGAYFGQDLDLRKAYADLVQHV